MLLQEINEQVYTLTEAELREAMDLDIMQLYSTYGSWIHPDKPVPVYVSDNQGHIKKAQEILGPDVANQEETEYQKMFSQGWVRAVHNNMANFAVSGTKEALTKLLPKLAALRNATARIFLDVEDCSGGRCVSKKSGSYVMPAQWNELRRAV